MWWEVWVNKKIYMLKLKIDNSGTELEIYNKRRNLHYYKWEMARAEIQRRQKLALEIFFGKK